MAIADINRKYQRLTEIRKDCKNLYVDMLEAQGVDRFSASVVANACFNHKSYKACQKWLTSQKRLKKLHRA